MLVYYWRWWERLIGFVMREKRKSNEFWLLLGNKKSLCDSMECLAKHVIIILWTPTKFSALSRFKGRNEPHFTFGMEGSVQCSFFHPSTTKSSFWTGLEVGVKENRFTVRSKASNTSYFHYHSAWEKESRKEGSLFSPSWKNPILDLRASSISFNSISPPFTCWG